MYYASATLIAIVIFKDDPVFDEFLSFKIKTIIHTYDIKQVIVPFVFEYQSIQLGF